MHEISFSPFLIIRLPIVNKGLEFGTRSGELRSFLLQHVQNAKDEFPSALSHDSFVHPNLVVLWRLTRKLMHANKIKFILIKTSSVACSLFTIGNLIIRNRLKEISCIMKSDDQNFKVM